MSFEYVAELQILAKHIKALVPAELLQLGRMKTAIHARSERAALQAVAAETASAKTVAIARAWTIWATVCGLIAWVPIRGRGGG